MSSRLDRKNFLRKAGLSIFSIPFLGLKSPDEQESNECGYTDKATAGPFYVSNTKETVNLNYDNLPGTPMEIHGSIYGDPEGKMPVPEAVIEIWHCDKDGVYHPTGNGDISKYKPLQVKLRGYVISDSQGAYRFRSIVPGLYSGRRRHIHYTIQAEDYRSLTTQSYWLSEKGSRREKVDRTDRNTESCRYVDFIEGSDGLMTGQFDIYLASE